VCDSNDIPANNYFITIKSLSIHKEGDNDGGGMMGGGGGGPVRWVSDVTVVLPMLTSEKANEVVDCILKHRSDSLQASRPLSVVNAFVMEERQ
tara:strand:- start:148 stop:426 length:279 start_codon:yes stop_codon:yes gene_type:complete